MMSKSTTYDDDIVATWSVPMSNEHYKIEFCHGTTTGKRIIRVNEKELLHRDWMFKLVGQEAFFLNDVKCVITIKAIGIFAYEYSLNVGEKTFEKYCEEQKKTLQIWHFSLQSNSYKHLNLDPDEYKCHVRVCLEKDTMDIWVNGTKVETTGEFMEIGETQTHFEISPNVRCYIQSKSSGKRQVGIVHNLFVDEKLINPMTDDAFLESNNNCHCLD